MRIALLTIHYANSFGGMLQAYASKAVLSRFGEVTFLHYTPPHLADTMSLVGARRSARGVLRATKNILRILPRSRLLRKFRGFQSDHLPRTSHLATPSDLREQEQHFDVFVSGSDQIWNPAVLESSETTYFLDFVIEKRKISFASSMGSHRYQPEDLPRIRRLLSQFSAISVRENDTNAFLSSLLQRTDIKTILDPTLLLPSALWRSHFHLPPETQGRYLLVYTLKPCAAKTRRIREISKALNLPVVAIDQEPFLRFPADQHRNDIGPIEFLSLFANAAFVVTDSYHGTAFSINFNIPFLTLRPQSGINRISTLLKSVDLADRLDDQSNTPSFEIDFERVNAALSTLRAAGTEFLESALNQ